MSRFRLPWRLRGAGSPTRAGPLAPEMETDSEAKEHLEAEESAPANAENAAFMWETGKYGTPQKHVAEVSPHFCTPDASKTPLDFSTVTVEQLGITPDSFVRNSSGKSASCLKKSRRRSAVGARGSPETNHLIRFIAQQRSLKNAAKSPLAQDSPFQGSPGLYGNVNSLRERISAFQSAFHSIKEYEQMAACPDFSEAQREMETANLNEDIIERQQPGLLAEIPSKRRRISSQSISDEDLTDAESRVMALHIFNIDTGRVCTIETSTGFSKKSSELGLTEPGCLVEGSVPLSELTKASHGLKIADCVEGKGWKDAVYLDTLTTEMNSDTVPDIGSPACPAYKRDFPSTETFVLRSVLKKPSVKPFLESLQEHHDNLCDDGTPSLIPKLANCCKELKAEDQNYKAPAFLNMRKRKRVTFGEDLSPEVFDESLPANTPLRKGGTPVRKKDVSSISPLLLEQSPVLEQLPQPNFDDKGENLENIEPLHLTFAVGSPIKSSITETLSGTDTFSSSNNHEKISSCKVRPTRTSNRRKLISFTEENVCNLLNTETQPCKEKKINRRKSQETKYTSRALPKKSRVLKSCRKKKGRGKKGVQKSLYGKRDIASKKPLLSPIPELPEVSEMTPSVPSAWQMCSDDFHSNGKLEEVKPPKNPVKRKRLLPQNPEDLHMNQSFNKCDVPEFCSYIKGSSSFDTNTMDVSEVKNVPKAENNLENEMESNTGNENENSHNSCSSVTKEHVVSDNLKPDIILKCHELSASGQNEESLCEVFKISEEIKCEKQDDILVATEGKPQCNHFMSDSQNEYNYLGDALIENIKGYKSPREDVGIEITEHSSVKFCSEKKQRRRSMYCSEDQNLWLVGNRNHKPFHSTGSPVGISLENSKLYEDLSDAIEQSFHRTNGEVKVRRSTRLQKDADNEGLVWISLPFPFTSQKAKRRTICTSDSRGFEDMSPRRETVSSRRNRCQVPSRSGRENSKSPTAHSDLPEKRRKSFCTSSLANTKAPAQSKRCRRSTFLQGKGESSLTDLERVGHRGELEQ